MTSLLKPLAAAALLVVAGSAAQAAVYDWSYSGSFGYYADGVNYTGTIFGQLTGQLEGIADADGVTVTDMLSLTFNDGTTTYDLSGVTSDEYPADNYLLFGGPDNYFNISYNANSVPPDYYGVMVGGYIYVYINSYDNGPGWVSYDVGTWSLTEQVVPPNTAVPEPTTALLAMLGVPLVAWRARRRAQAEAA